MNTKFRDFMALAAMMMGLVAMADNTLVVHHSEDKAAFALSQVQRLTLDEGFLTVLADAEYQYPYLEINKLEFTTQLVGDVNGDSNVDVADVNAIINIMLGKSQRSDAADVDGDGNVDVSDVNSVINIMLGKANQQPDTDYRMFVHRTDGTTDLLNVNDVTSVTFVEIPEATTTITLIDADDSSVRARITRTEGTHRYEVACFAASETPDDLEAYIKANKKFSRKADGAVEFIELDPATPYVIAALAYDEYDLPCEVSTLEFTTAERVISADAQIGDYLYSDGTWSTELNANKTPVAIVYSLAPTDADRALGYTHGYAVALKDAGKAAWTTQADENESGSMLGDGEDVTDREGLTRTRTLLDNAALHLAAQQASNYANTPYGTSGWFLPATGQWIEIMHELGGLDANAYERTESGVATWTATQAAEALAAVNARLAATGSGKYAPLDQFYYWTSGERSVATAYYLYLNANFNMSIQTYYKDSEFTVRPVIAF